MKDCEMSTLIVGAKCKNGVVIAADRRVMRGTEYSEEKKIYKFGKVVISFSGLTGLKDKFLGTVEQVLRSARALNLSEAIIGVEDTMAALSERYEKRLGEGVRTTALLAGLENLYSGEAKLYHVLGNGYAEEIRFLCIGHGQNYATSIAQGLYQPNLSLEKMAEVAIFLIGWVENVDSSVGGIPDVVLVEKDKEIKEMEKEKIKKIYDNTKQIAKELPKTLFKAIQDPRILEPKKSK